MIELRHIGKDIINTRVTRILHNISFEVGDGEFICLGGKSGSGKSTLLYIMSGLDEPSHGEVLYNGKNLHRLSRRDLDRFRNEKMGFIFQFHYLIAELNCLDNVLLPAVKAKIHRQKRSFAQALLAQVGLQGKEDRRPSELSGGERQRVAIARALIMEPEIIFADEPTGSLDSSNGEVVMDILRDVNRKRQATVVLVTHDQDFAAYAERQIVLMDGRMLDAPKRDLP